MIILTFANTRSVIKAENTLKRHRLPYQVIPTPRHISSECGMCLKVASSECEQIVTLLLDENINIIQQIEHHDEG